MLKTTRRTLVAGAALVALGLATEAAAQEPVKIGVIYPLSGNSASALACGDADHSSCERIIATTPPAA